MIEFNRNYHSGFELLVGKAGFLSLPKIEFQFPPINFNSFDLVDRGNWCLSCKQSAPVGRPKLRIFEADYGIQFGWYLPRGLYNDAAQVLSVLDNLLKSNVSSKKKVFFTHRVDLSVQRESLDINEENMPRIIAEYNEIVKNKLGDYRGNEIVQKEESWYPHNCPPEERLIA